MKGGLGRPQPVLLPLFTKRLGEGWTTPLSTLQYNGKQGSGKILETCAHTCHSLDLGGSTSYYLGDWRRRKGERGGELVHNGNWFLNGYKKKEEMYEKPLWAKRCEITQTESISFQLKWVKTIKLIFLCRLRYWNVQNTHFSWVFRVTEMTTFPRRLSQTCKPSLSSLPVNF